MALIPVAPERQNMERERIETVACEAYASIPSQYFGRQVILSSKYKTKGFSHVLALWHSGCLPVLLPPLYLA